jgi:hypothetical protein
MYAPFIKRRQIECMDERIYLGNVLIRCFSTWIGRSYNRKLVDILVIRVNNFRGLSEWNLREKRGEVTDFGSPLWMHPFACRVHRSMYFPI